MMENCADQHVLTLKEEEEEALPLLPDDVLLQVFKYLPVPELFAARLVCRRWAALALHQDVWRHRSVGDWQGKGVLEATLRLAPCVRMLSIEKMYDGAQMESDPRLDVLVATTHCAAMQVHLSNVDKRNAVTASILLRNQEQLGRLRILTLHMHGKNVVPASARSRVLISTACAIEGLTDLLLGIKSDDDFHPDWLPPERDRPGKSSLKNLECRLSNLSWWPIVLRLLESHADTLECLSFIGASDFNLHLRRPEAESVASRVAGLRTLGGPLLRGMGALIRCDRLESLSLHFDTGLRTDVAVLRDAKEYLRKATQLKEFGVLKWGPSDATIDYLTIALDLVEALASSRRSGLQFLGFSCFWNSQTATVALQERLTSALGHFPALSEVRVLVDTEDVLLALMECVSRAASRDRPLTLSVFPSVTTIQWCVLAWVHQENTRIVEAFKKCPSLHVLVAYVASHTPDDCPTCLSLGHKPGTKRNYVLLFGHPEDSPCDAAQHADKKVACHRVGREDCTPMPRNSTCA